MQPRFGVPSHAASVEIGRRNYRLRLIKDRNLGMHIDQRRALQRIARGAVAGAWLHRRRDHQPLRPERRLEIGQRARLLMLAKPPIKARITGKRHLLRGCWQNKDQAQVRALPGPPRQRPRQRHIPKILRFQINQPLRLGDRRDMRALYLAQHRMR